MDTYTLKQDATIVELSGDINTKNNQGDDVKLRLGDTLKQNATFTVSAGTTFTLQYSDGTAATQDDLAINPIVTDNDAQSSEALAAAVDPEVVVPEIAALQAQILSGEDPTENLPDTAAGETAQAGNEGGGYVAVGRTGDETLANAGHDTAGFEQIELPRIDELPVFLTEFALPKVSARAVTLFEKHLEQGSEPQAAQLSQAENVSVNVQAGIQDLSINGVVVFEQGNFVGPVVITTPNGVLLISAYDSIDSILTYSYTLSSTLDHSNSDTIAEIFVLQLTDNQGVSTTSVVTANIVDDAPSGLDDINVISQSNLDGVGGNVLQNDTLGADLAAVTQIINSQNSSNDVAESTAISGIYGSLIIAADGSYHYQLNNQLPEIQSLALGEQLIESFNYLLTDSDGDSVTQALTITISGENDAPEITSSFEDALGNVTEAGVLVGGNIATDGIPQASGTLTADDVDNGAVLTWQLNDDPVTPYGIFTLNESTGAWSFTLDNEFANSLGYGDTETEIFNITVTDEFGLSDTQMFTVTITGTNDIPVLSFAQGADTGIVKEAGVVDINDEGNTPVAGIDSVSGQFNADDVDINDGETWSVQGTPNTEYGQFSVDSNGLWTYALDNDLANSLFEGQVVVLNYSVRVTDNYGAYADQDVNITITGTNDIPVLSFEEGADAGIVKEAGVVDINDEGNTAVAGIDSVSGQLNADDVDINDGETWSVQGTPNTEYGQFSVDSNGLWTYALDNDLADSLFEGQVVILNYTVRVTDNYGAYADQDVTITITGTNDIPVLSFEEGADAGIVKEAGVVDINDEGNTPVAGIDSVSGQFNADDVDINDGETWSVQGTPNTEYGQFSVDSNGLWTYALDNDLADSLFEGQVVILNYTVRVT
ncbi:retention module-containing protein, partial [Shewanella pealeana]